MALSSEEIALIKQKNEILMRSRGTSDIELDKEKAYAILKEEGKALCYFEGYDEVHDMPIEELTPVIITDDAHISQLLTECFAFARPDSVILVPKNYTQTPSGKAFGEF